MNTNITTKLWDQYKNCWKNEKLALEKVAALSAGGGVELQFSEDQLGERMLLLTTLLLIFLINSSGVTQGATPKK
jgi:hypothetical protein